MIRAALALDPGATTGAALVTRPFGDDSRPRCLAACAIAPSRPSKGSRVVRAAEFERRYLLAARQVLLGFRCLLADYRLDEVVLVVERRPLSLAAGDVEEFEGLVSRVQQLSDACVDTWGRAAQRTDHTWWTAQHEGIPTGKLGDGSHRVEEASARVAGAGVFLEVVKPARARVDVAEAVLVAAAEVLASAGRAAG